MAHAATSERVERFSFADGQLSERRSWSVLPPDAPKANCVPAGVALTRDGRTLCMSCAAKEQNESSSATGGATTNERKHD